MSRRSNWRVVGICWLAQNSAIGLSVGSYGAALITLQENFGVSREGVSYGLGIMLLTLGLAAPLVGMALQKINARTLMIAGAVMNLLGYVLLSQTTQLWQFLAIFALLIGPGACMLGIIPPSTIVSRWFRQNRGKALAITNMPAFIFIIPPIAAALVADGGTPLLYGCIAAAFAALILPLTMLKDRPDEDMTASDTAGGAAAQVETRPLLSGAAICRDARFWLLSLGVGILTGSGAVFNTHIFAMAAERGVAATEAALPMSAYGIGSLVGSLLFGWLIDRFGSIPMLVLNTVLQVLLWGTLAQSGTLGVMAVLSIGIGACMGSLIALHASALNDVLGADNFSRAMGISYLIKVPFLFGLAPLAGRFYDATGSYTYALFGVAILMAISSILMFALLFASSTKRMAMARGSMR